MAPPERCPTVTAEQLRSSSGAAVDWFVRNQEADGTWLYLYDADEDAIPPEYNAVRHAGVTMGLYQAAAGFPERCAPPTAARSGRSTPSSSATTGPRSSIRARCPRARAPPRGRADSPGATGDTRYDGVLRRLGRFLLTQTEPSGAVLADYDPTSGTPVAGEYSKYYTGRPTGPWHGFTARSRARLGEAADRIGAYLATSRDEVEDYWRDSRPLGRLRAGRDRRVPRACRRALMASEAAYARRQAELFGSATRWVSQQLGPWGEVVRGPETPRGGGYGVIGEALTGWWLVARREPGLAELEDPIAERAACIAGAGRRRPIRRRGCGGRRAAELVEGAWFADGETRWTISNTRWPRCCERSRSSRRSVDLGQLDPGDDAPSGWLWAVVLLLALNPARAAFGVPAPADRRRTSSASPSWAARSGGSPSASSQRSRIPSWTRSRSASPPSGPRPGSSP